MKYNKEFLDIKCELIKCFLIEADKNILDISFNIQMDKIEIQVVLLVGNSISKDKRGCIEASLNSFEIIIREIYLSKEKFNENKGDWLPINYKWLDYLLFTKSEA